MARGIAQLFTLQDGQLGHGCMWDIGLAGAQQAQPERQAEPSSPLPHGVLSGGLKASISNGGQHGKGVLALQG